MVAVHFSLEAQPLIAAKTPATTRTVLNQRMLRSLQMNAVIGYARSGPGLDSSTCLRPVSGPRCRDVGVISAEPQPRASPRGDSLLVGRRGRWRETAFPVQSAPILTVQRPAAFPR